MSSIFPEPIINLPEADIPLEGVKAFLSQGENYQIIFMEFEKDVNLPEHSHESQWEVVVEGKVDLVVEGHKQTFRKGERFFIPKGAKHSAKVYAGYTSIAFFNQKKDTRKRNNQKTMYYTNKLLGITKIRSKIVILEIPKNIGGDRIPVVLKHLDKIIKLHRWVEE